MSLNILSSEDVVEAMVEYVKANIQLNDLEISEQPSLMTFQGRGFEGDDDGLVFSLEVVTNRTTQGRAIPNNMVEDRIKNKSAERLRKDRIFTEFLFPRSLDYKTAKTKFYGHYLKKPSLLDQIRDDPLLMEIYRSFERNNVKIISRAERKAMELNGPTRPYFHPAKRIIESYLLSRFREDVIIPDNRPRDQHYFWDYVIAKHFPAVEQDRRSKLFRAIQEGLHNKVLTINQTQRYKGPFTLTARGVSGARIKHPEYQKQSN